MDIYAYLKKDHKAVASLMDQVIASSDPTERRRLFETIKTELTLHADSEEQTFYKAVEDATRAKAVEEQMEHAHHEHDDIREYLVKLSDLAAEDEQWIETFGEFKHAVSHHVEEEEGDVFEKARKYLDHNDAVELAKEMDELKQQYRAKITPVMDSVH